MLTATPRPLVHGRRAARLDTATFTISRPPRQIRPHFFSNRGWPGQPEAVIQIGRLGTHVLDLDDLLTVQHVPDEPVVSAKPQAEKRGMSGQLLAAIRPGIVAQFGDLLFTWP